MSQPVHVKDVVTLNMSWEANNWGGAGPAQHAKFAGSRQWRHVADSWNKNKFVYDAVGMNVFGPAYMNSLRAIRAAQPDIILLQEFQIPTVSPDADMNTAMAMSRLVDVLNSTKTYTVAAIATDVMGGTRPAVASVVITSGYTVSGASDISDSCREAMHNTTRQIGVKFPFPNGRSLAAALLAPDDEPTKTTLIISSHSEHGVPWASRDFCQGMLNSLLEASPRRATRPTTPRLIWGGDFNSKLDMKGAKYGSRSVFAHKAAGSTTHFGSHQVDWIVTTRQDKRVAIKALTVNTVGSDHMLGMTSTSGNYYALPEQINM